MPWRPISTRSRRDPDTPTSRTARATARCTSARTATNCGSNAICVHPVEKVWAALTNPAQLAQWLAPGEIELTLGGRVFLAFTDGDGVIDGQVTAFAPPRLLEFTWTDKGNDLGFVRWELVCRGRRHPSRPHPHRPRIGPRFWSPDAGGVAFPAREVGGPARRPAHVRRPDRWQEFHDDYARAG